MESVSDSPAARVSDFANGQVNNFLDSVEDLTKALKDIDSPDIARVRAKVKIALVAAKSAVADTASQIRHPGSASRQATDRFRARQSLAGHRNRGRSWVSPSAFSRRAATLDAAATWRRLCAPPLRDPAGLVLEQDSRGGQLFPDTVRFREVLGGARRPPRAKQRLDVGVGHGSIAHAALQIGVGVLLQHARAPRPWRAASPPPRGLAAFPAAFA